MSLPPLLERIRPPLLDLSPPEVPKVPPATASPYEVAVRYANVCNATICKLNESKRARRAAAVPGSEPISDDEEEQPIPDPAAFVFLPPPETRPLDGGTQIEPGRANPLHDSTNLEIPLLGNVSAIREDTAEPDGWREFVSTAVANNPTVLSNLLAPRPQVVDYQTLGPIYTFEEANQNTHTFNSKCTPNSILQMAYGKSYVHPAVHAHNGCSQPHPTQ